MMNLNGYVSGRGKRLINMVKVNSNELSGIALDWAVSICEREPIELFKVDPDNKASVQNFYTDAMNN
jgi:hypothetical protein